MVNWISIESEDALNNLISENTGLILFKHSERCSISRMSKKMFEAEYNGVKPVYLINVIEARPVSNKIAETFAITHQSPQLLVINNGKCIHHASHDAISAADIPAVL